MAALTASWNPASRVYVGRFRMVLTGANMQPAVAGYLRGAGEAVYRAAMLGLLRIEQGRIVEITSFHDAGLFPAFDLPPAMPSTRR
jgi:RNA polymerase sigma-70 factor (ECF subfamily)